jgi:hypothetical protein
VKKNPKSQVPNPKEVPKSKFQSWAQSDCLGFEIWDFFGAWDLGFGTLT